MGPGGVDYQYLIVVITLLINETIQLQPSLSDVHLVRLRILDRESGYDGEVHLLTVAVLGDQEYVRICFGHRRESDEANNDWNENYDQSNGANAAVDE